MESVQCKIDISESTKERIPQLRRVFSDIANHRCILEVVGVANFRLTSETDGDIIAVRVTAVPEGFNSSSMSSHTPISQTQISEGGLLAGLPRNHNLTTTISPSQGMSPEPADAQQASFSLSVPERDSDEIQNDESRSLDEKYKHTLYHVMHNKDDKCPFINDKSLQKCTEDYEETFANSLKALLNNEKREHSDINYDYYISDHLKNHCKCSSSCDRLWKYCFSIKDYSALNYAEEGLVVFSTLEGSMVGRKTDKYKSLEAPIGHGGFGKVYKISDKLVVKEEHTRPLIFSNPTVFQQVTKLNCKYVVSLLEYVVGKCTCREKSMDNHPIGNKPVFYSVMPYMNRRGLNEQFKTHTCILKYMEKLKDQRNCIFNNYLVMFSHVFQGLEYLHRKKIVHGDIKDRNILVNQTCACQEALLCSCPDGGRVTYVLGDMSLYWTEGKRPSGKYVKWAKAKLREPAGTAGMKAPELYFTGEEGENYVNAKADIWAGSVTMMKILTGLGKVHESTEQITEYLKAISRHSIKHVNNIHKAHEFSKELQQKINTLSWSQESSEEKDFIHKLNSVVELLKSDEQLEHTQWMLSYTYPEKFPLPYLLGVAHGASRIDQQCLDKLPDVFNTTLWKKMKDVTDIITSGIRFLPEDRLSAAEVTNRLRALRLQQQHAAPTTTPTTTTTAARTTTTTATTTTTTTTTTAAATTTAATT